MFQCKYNVQSRLYIWPLLDVKKLPSITADPLTQRVKFANANNYNTGIEQLHNLAEAYDNR